MTVEQILKGLNCCPCSKGLCDECPIDQQIKENCECAQLLTQSALALIQEQQAEIERLTVCNATRLEAYAPSAESIRADAIIEFAEKAKRYYSNLIGNTFSALVAYNIDQMAQEMTRGLK